MNGIRDILAYILKDRMLEHRSHMVCKFDKQKLKGLDPPNAKVKISLSTLPSLTILSLYGLQAEPNPLILNKLLGIPLKKPVHVSEYEDMLSWFELQDVSLPIPSLYFKELFECNIDKNIVFELWVLKLPEKLLESAIRAKISIAVPEYTYILSFKELVKSLKDLIDTTNEVRMFILSKYARPGYLGKFIDSFGGLDNIKLYVAIEEPSIPRYFKKKLEDYQNVTIIPTRSHRKLLLAIYEDEFGDTSVIGYWGSFNIFYPGVDDYLVSVNDYTDLQRLMHGLLRAFLIV